ncbi:GntR family transcriptional regulator [Streptomyces sp. SYP-A7185]|uniref:GntR family transcriptional regulator n=1 Tax=Streptomyces sp. SYP-A7185 TaxID=3040076 RepID=UPI0038F5D893
MFVFRQDSASGVPPYLQLVHQVRGALLLGYLLPGDRLPLIREVVADLAINPNTVAKAYRQLEQEGLVHGRPGLGTFVAAAPRTAVSSGSYAVLRRGLEHWLDQAAAAGLDDADVTALITAVRRRKGTDDRGEGVA